MPIRPIQIMQSQEVSQLKHMETQRAFHEQAQISKSFKEQIQHDKSKTTQAMKSDNHEFRYDAKEKGQNGQYSAGKKKKEENKKEKKKSASDKPTKSGGVDILI